MQLKRINNWQNKAIPADLRSLVERYESWLIAQTTLQDDVQERRNYEENARTINLVKGKTVATFAPFRAHLSAFETITTPQGAILLVMLLLFLGAEFLFRLQALTGLISLVTTIYFIQLIIGGVFTFGSLGKPTGEYVDERIVHALYDAPWPSYTILCPLYKEAAVVEQFVQAMMKLDYPSDKLQILFLTEEEDAETRSAIRALGQLPPQFEILVVPDGKPRTKPRACNFGLMKATGSYIVIYDAEDIPDPLQLKRAILTFANHDPNLACVQAQLNFFNPNQNMLTRWFTIEYSLWFDIMLPMLQRTGFSVPLGGTSNHFKTKILRVLGGWDAFNVTEDCDLGIRLSRYQFNTAVLQSTTYEEANSDLSNWIRQRSRWVKGFLQTYLVNMRSPFSLLRSGNLRAFFSLQVLIGLGTGILVINPVMWLMSIVYLLFRTDVEAFYHVLFPRPVLYAGMLCLIFGNFLYIYIAMLACVQRKHYSLIPFTFFLPFYWVLLSVASFKALWQLITRPHYWEKTQHGLHLKNKQQTIAGAMHAVQLAIEDEETVRVRAITKDQLAVPGIRSALREMSTLSLPAFSRQQKKAMAQAQKVRLLDAGMWSTGIVATVVGIAVTIYYFMQHQLLIYDDASSHLRVARSVIDSLTPGIAQLGSVWLPLPQLLFLPFVWNNYLWHTGLAGAFISTPCFVIAAMYVFLIGRRLTGNTIAGFMGALVFIANPNILYLQATPLTELLCIATFTASTYYFMLWCDSDKLSHLVYAAFATFISTLVRYDGWAFLLFASGCILLVGFVKKKSRGQIAADVFSYMTLGSLGVFLWFAWNQMIWGDFLYFQRGPYAAQTAQKAFIASHTLPTYFNLYEALRYFSLTTVGVIGILLCVFTGLTILIMLFTNRKLTSWIVFGAFVMPVLFYLVSLYTGQIVIYIPTATPPNMDPSRYFFNVRYGVVALALVCLSIAMLFSWIGKLKFVFLRILIGGLLLLTIGFQIVSIYQTGVVTLQDGQQGLACAPHHESYAYLAQNYSGGLILESMNAIYPDATDSGINFNQIVYQGSDHYWSDALRHPQNIVAWVIISPNDLVAKHINHSELAKHFTLVVQEGGGVQLYRRNDVKDANHAPYALNQWTNRQFCPQ